MPPQGWGRARHPEPGTLPCWEQQACTHHPGRFPPCRHWWEAVLDYGPLCPLRLLCSVFWCDGQSAWGFFSRLWEAVCLISRPCNVCCSSRCCGLQSLGIPCVRTVGLGLEFWNLIWENLSSHQKCTMTWPANLSFSGFECTRKGLMCMENTVCQRIPGTARAGQKHGPKHRS